MNISEPIISFVNTFKKNPKRFKLTKENFSSSSNYMHETFWLEDKLTELKYCAKKCKLSRTNKWSFDITLKFKLTEQEKKYLIDNIVNYYSERYEKLKSIKELRARNYLYNIYKECGK